MEANFEHEPTWKDYLFGNNWANIAWFFMGGICGTSFLAWIFWKYHDSNYLLNAAFVTLGLILLKEFLDTITSLTRWQGRFGFDPAGGDWRDIFLGFLGIVLTLILLSI